MTSVTFSVTSTISMTRMKSSTLINEGKHLLDISKIENLFMQLMLLLHIVKPKTLVVQGIP